MPVVTASTTAQLHQHLRDAFNNQQDYEITLTGSTYMLTAANADSPSTNPDTSFPYGMAGAFRSHLPQIRTNVIIKSAANIRAKITRNTTLSATYRHFYVRQFASLTLERLDIEKGDVGTVDTGGGAILNEGTLLLKHCRLGPTNFSNYGGAILNLKGTTTLENCDVFQNEADWGGGLYKTLPI